MHNMCVRSLPSARWNNRMVYFSVVASSATRAAYVVDTHGANTSHIIALTEFVLDVLVYGSTFFLNGIVLSAGVERTLLVLGAA